jgi:hypothetical protein
VAATSVYNILIADVAATSVYKTHGRTSVKGLCFYIYIDLIILLIIIMERIKDFKKLNKEEGCSNP